MTTKLFNIKRNISLIIGKGVSGLKVFTLLYCTVLQFYEAKIYHLLLLFSDNVIQSKTGYNYKYTPSIYQ